MSGIERDDKGRFVPGNKGGGRGHIRDKLSHKFLEDVHDAWKSKGKAAIEHMAENDQSNFVRVVASLLPKETTLTVNRFEGMSDADIDQYIAQLDEELAEAAGDSDRKGGGERGEKAPSSAAESSSIH